MMAVHRRIKQLEQEISEFKKEQNIQIEDELLPETYFKLKYKEEIEENPALEQVDEGHEDEFELKDEFEDSKEDEFEVDGSEDEYDRVVDAIA